MKWTTTKKADIPNQSSAPIEAPKNKKNEFSIVNIPIESEEKIMYDGQEVTIHELLVYIANKIDGIEYEPV
jgi:hypothetical protein